MMPTAPASSSVKPYGMVREILMTTQLASTDSPRSDAKRRAIIAVAREAFLARGYAATSMSEIAANLGGSKGTLYNYFRSKEELFGAFMVETCQGPAGEVFGRLPPLGESGDIRESSDRPRGDPARVPATRRDDRAPPPGGRGSRPLPRDRAHVLRGRSPARRSAFRRVLRRRDHRRPRAAGRPEDDGAAAEGSRPVRRLSAPPMGRARPAQRQSAPRPRGGVRWTSF